MSKNEYPYVEAGKRFARDTDKHEMQILHDNDLYRHVAFRNPDRAWNYWFDLITFPGGLVFQGDGDTYAFRRIDDMFEFFRQPGGASINPSYWSEKLVGPGRERQATSYQQEMLVEYLNETVREAVEQEPDTLSGLADAVQERVLDELIGDESIDRQLVDGFRYWANDADEYAYPSKRPDFEFHDTFDVGTHDYDWWFLWACNAIAWGIRQYDAHRTAEGAA